MTLTFEPLSHTYAWDGEIVPSVTRIIQPLNEYRHVPEGRLMAAADRGTAVHLACEHVDRDWDLPLDFSEDHAGYVLAWGKFREDSGFIPDEIELRIYHPGESYAGTIDRVGVLDGRKSIVDLKTSYRLGPAVGVQLAGYALAYNHGRRPREHATHRYAVRLDKAGNYEVREYSDPLDHVAFIACLDLYRWAREAGKGDRITEPLLQRHHH